MNTYQKSETIENEAVLVSLLTLFIVPGRSSRADVSGLA